MLSRNTWLVVGAVLLAVGCNQPASPTGDQQGKGGHNPDPKAAAEGKKFLLDSEPAGAKGVLDLRNSSKDGDDVVLVAHIAGSENPFVEGRCSFTVADLSIKPCLADEGCKTPWDCCCTPKEELRPALAQVKFVGADGKTLPAEARDMFGVKELSTVVVKGKANRDEKGNLTVVGSGIFVRKDKP